MTPVEKVTQPLRNHIRSDWGSPIATRRNFGNFFHTASTSALVTWGGTFLKKMLHSLPVSKEGSSGSRDLRLSGLPGEMSPSSLSEIFPSSSSLFLGDIGVFGASRSRAPWSQIFFFRLQPFHDQVHEFDEIFGLIDIDWNVFKFLILPEFFENLIPFQNLVLLLLSAFHRIDRVIFQFEPLIKIIA